MPAQITAVIDNLVNAAGRVGEATNAYADTVRVARQLLSVDISVADLRADVARLTGAQRTDVLARCDKATPRTAVDATDVLDRLRALLEGGA